MPSRKRSKAKERRAKKIEARISRTAQSWQGKITFELTISTLTFLTCISSPIPKEWSLWGIENPKIQCDHGCNNTVPNNDHPMYKFIETFIRGVMTGVSFHTGNLKTLFKTMPEVWKEETLRNETVRILTSIATNLMLHEFYLGTNSLSHAIQSSKAIIALESHNLIRNNDIISIHYHPKIVAKFKNLNPIKASGKRDVLKFLTRRISCSCLKEMYRQARLTIPKSRLCSYCGEVKERDQLMLCGRCRLEGYCSIECQAADWEKEHKQNCTEFVDYQNAYQIR